MKKLINSYYALLQELVDRKEIEEMPCTYEEMSVTYDLYPGETVWRVHINAGDMTIVATQSSNGKNHLHLPFKNTCMFSYLLDIKKEFEDEEKEAIMRAHYLAVCKQIQLLMEG